MCRVGVPVASPVIILSAVEGGRQIQRSEAMRSLGQSVNEVEKGEENLACMLVARSQGSDHKSIQERGPRSKAF